MTIPIGRYASLGPEIPIEGMPDVAPMRIRQIQELRERNALNEVVVLVDAMGWQPVRPVKLILGVRPQDGEVMRAAFCIRPGTGFVAFDVGCLPGNITDIVRTIVLDPRPTG
jgi:hypothetical protein